MHALATRLPERPVRPTRSARRNDLDRPALASLALALDKAMTLRDGAFFDAVRSALDQRLTADDLLDDAQQAGDPDRYVRHVLHSHPDGLYTIVALVWQPGQRTPVHGHQTWCAYRMIQGTLRETRYDWNPADSRAVAARVHSIESGYCSVVPAGLDAIHDIEHAGTGTAISLHVYGVAAEHVTTRVNWLTQT